MRENQHDAADTSIFADKIKLCGHREHRLCARRRDPGTGRGGGPSPWRPSGLGSEQGPSPDHAHARCISINGLWKWQPADPANTRVPTANWGYFKVPGCWPGITDYMQKDCQTVFAHPSWQARRLGSLSAAWYQREIAIPRSWAGRRIAMSADCLNSLATVLVDGKVAGEIRFPGGDLDLSAFCHPGDKHVLSMLVVAAPLRAVMLSYTDSASARQVKGVSRDAACAATSSSSPLPAGPVSMA